jgi:hypothetical protein
MDLMKWDVGIPGKAGVSPPLLVAVGETRSEADRVV